MTYNRETGEPVKPLPIGQTVKLEMWLRRNGLTPLANALARWDERKLRG